MLVTEIVNHTPYTIGFTYGDKEIVLASRGLFNANHAYNKNEDAGVLRIVDDEMIISLAARSGIPNFITLSDMLEKYVKSNSITEHVCFFVNSGFGKAVNVLDIYKPTTPYYQPDKNRVNICDDDHTDHLGWELAIPESFFKNSEGTYDNDKYTSIFINP